MFFPTCCKVLKPCSLCDLPARPSCPAIPPIWPKTCPSRWSTSGPPSETTQAMSNCSAGEHTRTHSVCFIYIWLFRPVAEGRMFSSCLSFPFWTWHLNNPSWEFLTNLIKKFSCTQECADRILLVKGQKSHEQTHVSLWIQRFSHTSWECLQVWYKGSLVLKVMRF